MSCRRNGLREQVTEAKEGPLEFCGCTRGKKKGTGRPGSVPKRESRLLLFLHLLLLCISAMCTAQWLDNHALYTVFPWYFQYPAGPTHSYYSITDRVPCAGLYIYSFFLK